MKKKFSDRIGVTSPSTILQIDGMNDSLRNSIWNYLLRKIFLKKGASAISHFLFASEYLCAAFIKKPIDEMPLDTPYRREWFKKWFYSLKWYEVYNLLEFIEQNVDEINLELSVAADYISDINKILEEEMSAYRFINSTLAPISHSEEVESISSSIQAAEKAELFGTKQHIETAIQLMSKKPTPDYRNSIKESISAIESVVKQIIGEEAGGLDKALTKLDTAIKFHGGFKSGLLSFYGYTSDASGIRHAILGQPNVDFDDAKFMLVSCSALVNFIISKATEHGLLK